MLLGFVKGRFWRVVECGDEVLLFCECGLAVMAVWLGLDGSQ